MGNRNVLDRMPRAGERRRKHLGPPRRRRSNNAMCDAMMHHPESGWIECEGRSNHRGDHMDADGTRWTEQEAVY